MILLNATTKSLEVDLDGVVSTNQLPFVVSYSDVSTSTFAITAIAEADGTTNNTTAVTLVAAPGASTSRKISLITIYNADTAAAIVTVQYNNNATLRTLCKTTLQVGDTLQYTDGGGFQVIDSAGNIQISAVDTTGFALTANPLSQFAATTSAQLAGVLSDETGSGAAVFGTSPSLTTPTIAGATLSGSLAGTPTFTGLFTNTAFGAHSLSAGGTGAQLVIVRNTTIGGSNYAQVRVGNDTENNTINVTALSSNNTFGGINVPGGGVIDVQGVGGLSIASVAATRFYTGGTTERWRMETTGHLVGLTAENRIRTNTSDGSDNASITIAGGGATGVARGADFGVYGNEEASNGGSIVGNIGNTANSHFRMDTSAITALKILGTDASATFTSSRGSDGVSWQFTASDSTSPRGINVTYSGANPNGTGNPFIRAATTAGGEFFAVRSNGGIANFSANDVNLSDENVKDIFGPAPPQRDLFRRLKLVEARYKDASPDSPLNTMVTAQQVQTIYPDLVEEFSEGKLGVREHGLIMRSFKVVQELDSALIELTTRVRNLEQNKIV